MYTIQWEPERAQTCLLFWMTQVSLDKTNGILNSQKGCWLSLLGMWHFHVKFLIFSGFPNVAMSRLPANTSPIPEWRFLNFLKNQIQTSPLPHCSVIVRLSPSLFCERNRQNLCCAVLFWVNLLEERCLSVWELHQFCVAWHLFGAGGTKFPRGEGGGISNREIW